MNRLTYLTSELSMARRARFILCFLLLICATTILRAYEFEAGGIVYNILSDTEAEVALGDYSGDITISSTVTDNGKTYSVISIGDDAFYNCSGLTSIEIPESVTHIGSGAFSWCSGLTSIVIPNSVTYIGEGAFAWCESLTAIALPASLTSIGSYAFYNCRKLTSIAIPKGVTGIDYAVFYNCSSLTSIALPEGLTGISGFAFNGCTALTSMAIPDCVTSIGEWAFYGCSGLTSMTIPNSVASIGELAFSGCWNLTSIISLIEEPFAITDGFTNWSGVDIYSSATLYCPNPEAYSMTNGWKEFKNIKGLDELPTAIRQVESNREGRGVVYDLNGHRVEHPTKGLYVVNGKKVMMK